MAEKFNDRFFGSGNAKWNVFIFGYVIFAKDEHKKK
jgi:hypothetical protein